MIGLLNMFGSIPFIGKYKRVIGGAGLAAGALLGVFGLEEVGKQVTDISLGVTGFGLAHAGAKNVLNGATTPVTTLKKK